jgi:hypothetical protein
MLDVSYEVFSRKREELSGKIQDLKRREDLAKYRGYWKDLALKGKEGIVGAQDGSMNHLRYKSLALYALNSAALVLNGRLTGKGYAEVDILYPYRQVEERVGLYRTIFEVKAALQVIEEVDLFLLDGSLYSDLVAPRNFGAGLSEEGRREVLGLLPELEEGEGVEIISKRLAADLEGEDRFEKIIFLEYLEYLSCFQKLLEKGVDKLVGVSKTSSRSSFGEGIPDIAVFDAVSRKPGYGFAREKTKTLHMAFPVYQEFFQSVAPYFTYFYARLEEGRDVLMVEVPGDIDEERVEEILSMMKYTSVDGYPYPLRKPQTGGHLKKGYDEVCQVPWDLRVHRQEGPGMVGETVGICIGESTPTEVTFVSRTMPESGAYVVLSYDGKSVLGMIEGVVRGSPSISEDILDPAIVERILEFEGEREQYVRGRVRLLGDVANLEIPKVPPPPGTKIMAADAETLRDIFGSGDIKLGTLLSHPEVPVYVDANRMIGRHLAVLAITGAGKSNTVSVILDGVLALGGMPVIFDMHSEYTSAEFRAGGVKVVRPQLNPYHLSSAEFRILVDVGKEAHLQERYLRRAYNEARERIKAGGSRDFVQTVIDILEDIRQSEEDFTQTEKGALLGVLNKVEDFRSKYEGLVNPHAPDIISGFEQGRANVIDLGQVDEDYADVIVSHVLRKLLHLRKGKEIPPAFCVIEEAHILAPQHRPTLSKYWIDRIAREGRKFGVGLCMVSQRPKSLDQNSLSQCNNAIIMRLVEPSDQRHVQQASERLSDDLLSQLPSLNIGEAVVVGLMTRIPALVKIDLFQGKLSGGDPDIVGEWAKAAEKDKAQVEKEKREIDDLYEGMDE